MARAGSRASQFSRLVAREWGRGSSETPSRKAGGPAPGHLMSASALSLCGALTALAPSHCVKHHGSRGQSCIQRPQRGSHFPEPRGAFSGLPSAARQPSDGQRWCERRSPHGTASAVQDTNAWGVSCSKVLPSEPFGQQPFSHSQGRSRAPGHQTHAHMILGGGGSPPDSACGSLFFVLLPSSTF